MTVTVLFRRVKTESDTPGRFATASGFRSSFRDWTSEQEDARDLAERALAHNVANKIEAAYHRTELPEHRPPDDGGVGEAGLTGALTTIQKH